ncbi:MAG: hypothetical protein HY078_01905 [Elusimicrobia bacterium]|nr:hypothetical protein [Elusimicrobiota bacterium]
MTNIPLRFFAALALAAGLASAAFAVDPTLTIRVQDGSGAAMASGQAVWVLVERQILSLATDASGSIAVPAKYKGKKAAIGCGHVRKGPRVTKPLSDGMTVKLEKCVTASPAN